MEIWDLQKGRIVNVIGSLYQMEIRVFFFSWDFVEGDEDLFRV